MDATAKSSPQPIAAFVFFYIFRLFMTLVMLPILMGFVIKAFVNLNDSLTSQRERRRLVLKECKQDRFKRTTDDASARCAVKRELNDNSQGKCGFVFFIIIICLRQRGMDVGLLC
jgi:hypothetical protein